MKPAVLMIALTPFTTAHAGVEIIAGTPKTEAVSEPFSIAFDSKGAAYGVEFTKSNRIFHITPEKVEFVAGTPYNAETSKPSGDRHDGPDPFQAVFHGMHDLQITRDDRAIIADSFNHRIRLLDLKTGRVSTIAGTGTAGFGGDGGPATEARLNSPMTASLSPDGKRIYIADIGNHRTRMVDLDSGLITSVAGSGQKGLPADGGNALEASMGDTRAVTQAADGTLYVLLRGGNSLIAVKEGKVETVVNASGKKGYSGDGGPGREATLNGPKYVIMDTEDNVLIADTENHCIRRYSPRSGKIELVAGIPQKVGDKVGADLLDTQLSRPHGVRIGPDGQLYIADSSNNRVLRGSYK